MVSACSRSTSPQLIRESSGETRRELALEPYHLGDTGENRITECYPSLRDAPAGHGPQSGILVHRGIAPIGNFDKRDFAVNGANVSGARHWICMQKAYITDFLAGNWERDDS